MMWDVKINLTCVCALLRCVFVCFCLGEFALLEFALLEFHLGYSMVTGDGRGINIGAVGAWALGMGTGMDTQTKLHAQPL